MSLRYYAQHPTQWWGRASVRFDVTPEMLQTAAVDLMVKEVRGKSWADSNELRVLLHGSAEKLSYTRMEKYIRQQCLLSGYEGWKNRSPGDLLRLTAIDISVSYLENLFPAAFAVPQVKGTLVSNPAR